MCGEPLALLLLVNYNSHHSWPLAMLAGTEGSSGAATSEYPMVPYSCQSMLNRSILFIILKVFLGGKLLNNEMFHIQKSLTSVLLLLSLTDLQREREMLL